jgi:uncharacterized protein
MKYWDTITLLVKPVSADCNMSCTYCFYSPKSLLYPDENHPRMNEETLSTLTEKALSTGAQNVSIVWQGGEPTLAGLEFYKKAVQLQALYKYPTQKISNSIQTNGILIDNLWTRFLKNEKWLVGVSLDGNEDQHNSYRVDRGGGGTFHKVRKALRLLQSEKVPYNILVLLNNVNVKEPKRLYSNLKKEGHRYLQFIPCIEYDPDTYERTNYSITSEEYGKFLIEIFDEWIKDIPNVFVRDFEDIMINEVTGISPNCVYSGECGQYLVVEYNGDVYPCDFYVDYEWLLGNIHEDPIEELINNKRFKSFLDNRKLYIHCKSCPWLKYCNGGCQQHVQIDRNYFCESYKIFFEHADEKIQCLKKTLNR